MYMCKLHVSISALAIYGFIPTAYFQTNLSEMSFLQVIVLVWVFADSNQLNQEM